MTPPPDARPAKALLDALAAEPRPAGSDAEARARALCAERLRGLGFAVAERPFDYSAFPGRYATPLVGLAGVGGIMAAGHVGFRGHPGAALALLAAAGIGTGAFALYCARVGILTLPVMRARGINLEAVRGVGEPRCWLVAHVDSKSQPPPIGVRAAGVAASALVWLVAAVVAVAGVAGADVAGWWLWLAVAAVVAGAPVVASVVGTRSPGALDNASGVATVLLAAAAMPGSLPIGVLITSAEELGLAGARAWARERAPGVAVNVDGVDDRGAMTAMFSGRRPERLARLAAAAGVRVRRLLPGILTDAVALADAGWETFTVSKGTPRTLARIHGPRDTADALDGRGIAESARAVAGIAAAIAAEVAREPVVADGAWQRS